MQKAFIVIALLVLGGFAYWSLQSELNKPEPTAAEMAAIQAVKTIVDGQKIYQQRKGRYAEHLFELGPAGENLIPRILAGTGKIAGYSVRLRGYGDSYQLSADPPEGTNQRTFFADQSGVIRENRGGAATASSQPLQ